MPKARNTPGKTALPRKALAETVIIGGQPVVLRPAMAAVVRRLVDAGGEAGWTLRICRQLAALDARVFEAADAGSPAGSPGAGKFNAGSRPASADRTEVAARRPGAMPPRPSRSIVRSIA